MSSLSIICSIFSWQPWCLRFLIIFGVFTRNDDAHAWCVCAHVWTVCKLHAGAVPWSPVSLHTCDRPRLERYNHTYMSQSRDPPTPWRCEPAAVCGGYYGSTVVELLVNLYKKWEIEGGRERLSFMQRAIFSSVHLKPWVKSTSAWVLLIAPSFKKSAAQPQSFTWQGRPFIVLLKRLRAFLRYYKSF